MSTKHLLDAELLPLVEAFPAFEFTDETMAPVRDMINQQAVLGDAAASGVERIDQEVTAANGLSVRCLVYQPVAKAQGRPGYLHIHGGGYVLGTPEMADAKNIEICAKLGAVVVSVDYRLAPEHPIPAPLDDCYAALAWLHESAAELGVDVARIAIGGESAGGGLAAALAQKAVAAGDYPICHQHLTYPMLDDRTGSSAAPGDPLVGEFIWTRASNAYGWSRYLG